MTVADFERMSIGFAVDYCVARLELEHGDRNDDENKYLLLKKNYKPIQEKYERGEISEKRYSEFMTRYKNMEALYGFDY